MIVTVHWSTHSTSRQSLSDENELYSVCCRLMLLRSFEVLVIYLVHTDHWQTTADKSRFFASLISSAIDFLYGHPVRSSENETINTNFFDGRHNKPNLVRREESRLTRYSVASAVYFVINVPLKISLTGFSLYLMAR